MHVVLTRKSDCTKNNQVVIDATLTAAKKGKASGRITAISSEKRFIKRRLETQLNKTLLSLVINHMTFYLLKPDSVRAID